MTIENLYRSIRIIDDHQDAADFDGEKPASLLALAESVLGVSFPETYRIFLRKYGCGNIFGEEFYGLIGSDFENSGVPDAVWLTLRERRESDLPSYLVIVYSIGDGSYAAIDCRKKTPQEECPVVLWVPGFSNTSQSPEILAQDFGDFLFNLLKMHRQIGEF